MVEQVGDVDAPGAVGGHTTRTVELTGSGPCPPDALHEVAAAIEPLDPVVAEVGHEHIVA